MRFAQGSCDQEYSERINSYKLIAFLVVCTKILQQMADSNQC